MLTFSHKPITLLLYRKVEHPPPPFFPLFSPHNPLLLIFPLPSVCLLTLSSIICPDYYTFPKVSRARARCGKTKGLLKNLGLPSPLETKEARDILDGSVSIEESTRPLLSSLLFYCGNLKGFPLPSSYRIVSNLLQSFCFI